MPPSVATVITNFRHGQHLADAVASVLAQTRRPDEIIVVDDASGRDEEPFLAALPSTIRVLRLATNVGPGGARQAGTDAASADLVAYLDADDLWLPSKLEQQLAHLAAHPDAAVSHTGATVFYADGAERSYTDSKPLHLTLAAQLQRNQVAPPTVLMRRQVLAAVGGWVPGRGIVEDWDLFIRIVHAGYDVVGLPMALTRVRRTGHAHLSCDGYAHLRRLGETAWHHRALADTTLGPGAGRRVLATRLWSHRHIVPARARPRLALATAMIRAGCSWPVARRVLEAATPPVS